MAMLPVLLFGAGCSGIHAQHSVSPLDFFMPGILKIDPSAPVRDANPVFATPTVQIAQAN